MIESLLLLSDLPISVHGKGAVELAGIRPLLKPLYGRVQKGHVLVFPDQIMRGARDVNEYPLRCCDKVRIKGLNAWQRNDLV